MIYKRGWAITAAVIGVATVFPLPHTARAADTIGTGSVGEMETEAGNIVADAVREAAGADIAFIPAAAFKPGVTAPRPATPEEIDNLLEVPADKIVVLTLQGSQVLAALARSVSYAPQPSKGFLQVSGLKFSYNTTKNGSQRIDSASLTSNAPLEAAKTYKVATTLPLANGGQGYYQIWDRDQMPEETRKAITDGTLRSLAVALTERATKTGKGLTATIDGRITRTEK